MWKRNLGSSTVGCTDLPGGVYGTGSTPAIDRADNRLFVVGGSGKLFALDLATGKNKLGFPRFVTTDPEHEYVYSGVTLFKNRVYVATASFCDVPPYQGRVMRFNAIGGRLVDTFYVDGKNGLGPSGGGIWGPGGASVDPTDGDVYVATGNALATPENLAYADQVVRLGPKLGPMAHDAPALVGDDVDFGATPVLYTVPGCPPQLVAMNKSGVLVLYDRDTITSGAVQRLQVANVNREAFVGTPAYSPVTHLIYVSNSTNSNSASFKHGLVALKTGKDCLLHLAWQKTVGPQNHVSPPTVAGGVVYYGDGRGDTVRAFNAKTGKPLWNSGKTIKGGAFVAPTVINGRVYVTAWDGLLHVYGL
jgi:outer membrane protein assembly factor BamB